MSGLEDLLVNLLDYVVEQSKDIDPNGFKLTGSKEFVKYKPNLQGLPGVDFDKKVEGDHIWMRVERLAEIPPPHIQLKEIQRFFTISPNPSGPEPSINESVLAHSIATDIGKLNKPEGEKLANTRRKLVTDAFASYKPLWKAWAEGEKPRRVTIGLYGELFSLKHQMESEETAKPHELVWGMGITSWKLAVEGRGGPSTVDYQYPLITQAMEISIEEQTMAIVLSPRAVDPRFEFDAFSVCHVLSAPEVEKACKESLAKNPEKQITPFDAGSYEHLLRLAAGNLHERGQFLQGQERPLPPTDDLVVTDAWVLQSRPRSPHAPRRRCVTCEKLVCVSNCWNRKLGMCKSCSDEHAPNLRLRAKAGPYNAQVALGPVCVGCNQRMNVPFTSMGSEWKSCKHCGLRQVVRTCWGIPTPRCCSRSTAATCPT